ncbi:hypothetical protein CAS74_003800 [Pichia kudriavzevii]|uniref:Uncharacterized protein n=1 Tax=Pichia kudriavzevii TaxID=4909 RepID=A0A1Z8JM80_PICKU|nr:hypothetical protein CAS74_003800 [Pichia kudriavzevii]
MCRRKSDQPTKSSQEELRVPIPTIFDVAEEKPTIAQYFSTIEQGMRNTELLQQTLGAISVSEILVRFHERYRDKIVYKPDYICILNGIPRRPSFSEKQELTKQVEVLIKQGFIKTSSKSFNSPVLFVRKKDGTMRMCVDYRILNNNTARNKFPLPDIDQLISRFGKAKVYSKLELMPGYYQVRIADEDVEKTAFSTLAIMNGCASATFPQMMNNVLSKKINGFVQVYLDDIFIYSEDVETHGKHVKEVLSTLRKHKLITKKSKCRFFYQEFRFLGQVVTPICIQTALEKIKKVKSWPTPKTVKEAQSFIGLTSYYRRYIKGHSKIANPIHKFITKQSKWTSEQDEAFNKLKKALISSPILVHPSWSGNCKFVLNTDACGVSLGYTLEHVISYGSKKLVGSQLNYKIYDREFMAVVEALRTWRYYLMRRHFIVMTDHKSLIYLKNQNLIDSTRVARWMDFLPQFDFDIRYLQGKNNSATDALSRYPYNHENNLTLTKIELALLELTQEEEHETQIHSLTLIKKEIITGYKKDTNYALIFRTVRDKTKVPVEIKNHIKHFCYQDEVLYYKTLESQDFFRVVIPNYKKLPYRIFKNAHDAKDAGHFGAWKTYLNLKDSFYWPSMLAQIRKWVETCRICQQHNTNTEEDKGGYTIIMVIVDRFSKMTHLIPTHKRLNAAACARLFSDKDIRFMNKFWQILHYLNGSSLLFSTTNHPETDGQTERLLRKYSSNDQLFWDEHLSMCEHSYNSTFQDSIKAINSWDLEDNKYSPNAEEFVRPQGRQEKHHNRKRRYFEYKVGDLVLVHRDAFGVNIRYTKIQPVWYGPYRLVKKINDNAYEVDLPVINLKDRESNVQWIKYYKENPNIYQEPPRTEREMLARINEMTGIGGWSEESGKEKTYDVLWKDCDQTLARKVPERIFNQADLSLRQSLMHNAKSIQKNEQA